MSSAKLTRVSSLPLPRALLLATSVPFATAAWCAQPPSTPDDAVVQLAPVTATGSNIKRLEIEKVLPVSRIGADQIEARDAATSTDLIVTIPQVTNIPATESTSGSQGARGDNANISLRGIPSSNTLILLNGRRVAPHGLTGDVVNINSLPTAGLDRIEVLRDGASSIYGSDAVAGVVNYVTKPTFNGTETRFRWAVPEHGGGQEVGGTVTTGLNFANNKGRWLSTLATVYRDTLFLRERDFSRDADKSALAPAPWNVSTSVFNGRSATTRFPSFLIGSAAATNYFRPTNSAIFTTTAPTRAEYDNINRFVAAIPQTARANWFNSVEYDLTPSITAFGEVAYYGAHSKMVRTPVAYSAPGSDKYIVLAADNPYNPYGSRFYSPTGAANSDGTARLTGTPQSVSLLNQTLEEGGPEKILVDSSVSRLLGGLRGHFGASSWTWEAAGLFSESKTTDALQNGIRESKILAAAARTDATAYNPFGYTFKVQNGAVVIDQPYVSPLSVQREYTDVMTQVGHSFLRSGDFRTGGNVFELPAGPIAVSLGGEFREEKFSFWMPDFAGYNPPNSGLDPEQNDFFGRAPKASFNANRQIYSAYAETVVPLVAPKNEVPAVRSLELSAAARFEHYSDFGDTTNPKFGANWKPLSWLMVRGSAGRGFSAPSLNTLYAPSSYTVASPPGVIDPVRNPVIADGRVLVRNIATGNANLQPERAEEKTAGIAVDVPFIKGLSFTADYWQLDRKGVITSVSSAEIYANDDALLRAYTQKQLAAGVSIDQIDAGSGTAAYKGDPRVVRFALTPNERAQFAAANAALPSTAQLAAIGTLYSVTTFSTNGRGKNFYSGYDFGLNYFVPVNRYGRFGVSADWAYFSDYYSQLTPTSARNYSIGEDGTPRSKSTVVLTWSLKGWSASASAYYSSSVTGSATTTQAIYESLGKPGYIAQVFDNGILNYRYVAGDSLSFNASAGYRFKGQKGSWRNGTSIRLGVTNLTDEKPPLSSATNGYNSSSAQYLFAGRTWTLQLGHTF
jgi:outer membrane receptor protein involved in Fe transport